VSTAGTTVDRPPLDAKAIARDEARELSGKVMGYVAVTVGFAALGAYLGRDLSGATGLVLFIAAFACIIGLNIAAAKGREQLAIGLLFGLGLLLGLAVAPLIAEYASADPSALWQAAGATAGFVAACGAYGYATRRDLSSLGAHAVLGDARPDWVRDRHDLRLDPQRQHHLCRRRTRDLRRVHDLRLQPAAPSERRQRHRESPRASSSTPSTSSCSCSSCSGAKRD
jgi:Inhibitor of apoptosis-promoting Bax1